MRLVHSKKKELLYISLLMLVFVISEIIINPLGNFSLNDEWLYAKKVFDFSNIYALDKQYWGRATMLTHILYGSLVANIFGFSYTVLHLATLFFSIFGIISFYGFL